MEYLASEWSEKVPSGGPGQNPPAPFLDLFGSRLGKPHGNLLRVGVQPGHRSPQGQRSIMLEL
jgi:hypothetical protein